MSLSERGGGGKGKHKRLRKAKLCYCFTSTWIHSHSGPGRCLAGFLDRRINQVESRELQLPVLFLAVEGAPGSGGRFASNNFGLQGAVFKWLFRLMKQLPTAAASIAWLSFGHRSSVWIADVTQRTEGYTLVCLVVRDVVDGSVMPFQELL